MRHIDNCYAHGKFADKLALVYSNCDNNDTPDLFRIADKMLYDHSFSVGYPVRCDVRCISPVNKKYTICRVIDCSHYNDDSRISDDFFGLILEPIVNLESDNTVTLTMLAFFNESEAFADGYTFGLFYSNHLNYNRLCDEMRKFDNSIGNPCRWCGMKGDDARKILNLLIDGIVTVDDIYNCLTEYKE